MRKRLRERREAADGLASPGDKKEAQREGKETNAGSVGGYAREGRW